MQILQYDVVIKPCAVEGGSLPPCPYMAFMLLLTPTVMSPENQMHFVLCELSASEGENKVFCKSEKYLSIWDFSNDSNKN